ncbi:MAG: cell division topological specificity factor MinE [Methylococcaceae bacterium]|nr:cell division topological specificity factor MinE [Methylococcaceae bacterium]
MSLLDYFRSSKSTTASVAKERLQILVAHERKAKNQKRPSYLPQLQQELLQVIRKYINVDQNAISVNFEQDEDQETFEVNIVLPDEHSKKNLKSTPSHNNRK